MSCDISITIVAISLIKFSRSRFRLLPLRLIVDLEILTAWSPIRSKFEDARNTAIILRKSVVFGCCIAMIS